MNCLMSTLLNIPFKLRLHMSEQKRLEKANTIIKLLQLEQKKDIAKAPFYIPVIRKFKEYVSSGSYENVIIFKFRIDDHIPNDTIYKIICTLGGCKLRLPKKYAFTMESGEVRFYNLVRQQTKIIL